MTSSPPRAAVKAIFSDVQLGLFGPPSKFQSTPPYLHGPFPFMTIDIRLEHSCPPGSAAPFQFFTHSAQAFYPALPFLTFPLYLSPPPFCCSSVVVSAIVHTPVLDWEAPVSSTLAGVAVVSFPCWFNKDWLHYCIFLAFC